ncbi:hypothetical protein AB0C28_46700 [Nonomuraea sp. NPDC048892]|uniref:hypothetical protein n=1 Tax=Nonomuraea sp. NPDC048892 TaxID=3154624 RepID=UPI0033D006E4
MNRPTQTNTNDPGDEPSGQLPPAAHALAELVTGAVTGWAATLRLCLVSMAISVPALTVLMLFLLLR